jgi:hypothetical protein
MKALKILSLLLLLASGVALGHGNTKPQHGGVVQLVGGETTFELVAKPEGAELYVVDDGEDIDSSTMSAMMVVDVGGTKSEFVMLAAGGNKYFAKGAQLPSGAKVAVSLVAADQSKTTARFTIK